MFRGRVFGGTPDAFHLSAEYGPQAAAGASKLPTPEALARMELDWTSNEADTQVFERFAQRQSALMLEQADERVNLELGPPPPASAAAAAAQQQYQQPQQLLSVRICVSSTPPVLRSLHFTRTAGSGSAPESLIRGLLQHMDLTHTWKLRGCEGLPSHFWAACADATAWGCLFNLNLSSCGLAALPAAVGQLASLHVLRLNHNKLTILPPELGLLTELEVLSVNHNQLTTLPAELRRCKALRELHLEYNRLATPVLDLSHATALESLQLYGNPLEFLPELALCSGLRSLSLANVRVMADAAYNRWEVEVTAPSNSSSWSSVMGGRGHKLQPLFNLTFRRSSIQHPLLAGAMGRLMEEPGNLELLVKEDVALQQLVLAAMGTNPLVVQQAVKVMIAAGAYAGAANRLVKHNVVRAITGLLASADVSLQLSGLRVLSSLAAGAAEGELAGHVLVPTALLDRLLRLITDTATHQDVRCAALHALGNSAFDTSNRRRYLQSPGLMQLLVTLAAAPDKAPPPTAAAHRQQASTSQGSSDKGDGTRPPSAARSPPGGTAAASQATAAPQQALCTAAGPGPVSGQQPEQQQPHLSTAATASAAGSPACVGPSTMTMQRTTSTSAGGEAAASTTEVTSVAQVSDGSSRALAVAAATSPGSTTADSGSGTAGMLSPRGAMAAAAGAAAAAAAAGAGDAPAGAAGAKAADGAGAAAVTAAPAPTLLQPPRHREKLVAVQDPVKLEAIRLLAVLGQNEQVRIALGQPAIRGRGLRVLAMDGGGMKGLAMVELLRQLERRAGAPIWSLFDVIGGTSTGGLLAVNLGVLRVTLDEAQEIYTSLGNKVFNQSSAVQDEAGWRDSLYRMYTTSSANMRVAVYGSKHDAANYEKLLREFCAVKELGCASDRLIDTAVMGGPKVFVVSTLASSKPACPFLFRNYELPDEATPLAEQLAACTGSCKHHVWEAVRASSAAPYYFDDFVMADGKRFQDGAGTANNPAVIALQQARLLHPQLPVECVVSLGCGSEPRADRSKSLSTVIDTGAVLLEGACSTDRVHEALAATLSMVPGCQYFRFNALDARCNMELDEIRPEVWSRLVAATSDYVSQPAVAAQFDRLARLLKQGSPAAGRASAGLVKHGSSGKVQQTIAGHKQTGAGAAPAWQQQQEQRGATLRAGGDCSSVQALLRPPGSSSTSPHVEQHQRPQQQQRQQQQQSHHSSTAAGVARPQSAEQPGDAEAPCLSPSVAPRLLFQKGVLLVGASCEVASTAAAAAAARGVSLARLQQQECVAQLLAAALPQELVQTCDLSAAAASSGCGSAPDSQQQQLSTTRQLQLTSVGGAAGSLPGSAEASPRQHGKQGGSSSLGGSNLKAVACPNPWQQQERERGDRVLSSSPPAPALEPVAVLAAAAAAQRLSDGGTASAAASPRPSSWLEYLLPSLGPGADGAKPGPATEAGALQQPDSGGPSPVKRPAGPDAPSRRSALATTGGSTVHTVQSSPDLSLPQQQQQQQEAGGSPRGSLLKLRSLPPQPLSSVQQQQLSDGALRNSHSPTLQHAVSAGGTPGLVSSSSSAGARSSNSSRHAAHQQQPILEAGGAFASGSSVRTAGCGPPAAGADGDSRTWQQQQQHPGVCEALRSQLLLAASGLGVVHLALQATGDGLVAGWQQRLVAAVEPGAEADELAAVFGGKGGCSLGQLVASHGPLLAGPDGALLAALSQQQVLAPVPTGVGGAVTRFVTAWLLQVSAPDPERLLGVAQVWPLLSQLQQLIVVSSAWLPKELVHVLLRGGVAAVVCGSERDAVAGLAAADVASFFQAFYEHGLWEGADVVQALRVAGAAVPAVGDSVYECCQLM